MTLRGEGLRCATALQQQQGRCVLILAVTSLVAVGLLRAHRGR